MKKNIAATFNAQKALLTFIAFIGIGIYLPSTHAQQRGCHEYYIYKNEAIQAEKQDFVLAVQKYLNATYCNPDSAKIDGLSTRINDLFSKIGRMEKQSKSDAARSLELTRRYSLNQAKTRKALCDYYFTEAELKFADADFRLAYLLAREALKYDPKFIPAAALLDTIYTAYPMNLSEYQMKLAQLHSLGFNEIREAFNKGIIDIDEYREILKNRWIEKNNIDPDSTGDFSILYDEASLSNRGLCWMGEDRLVFINLETASTIMTYEVDQFMLKETNRHKYHRDLDWAWIYRTDNQNIVEHVTIFDLHAKRIVKRGLNYEGDFYPQQYSLFPVCWESDQGKIFFYSIPDFNVVDSCDFLEEPLMIGDSVMVLVQGYKDQNASVETFTDFRTGQEFKLYTPESFKIRVFKKKAPENTRTVKATKFAQAPGVSKKGSYLIFTDSNSVLILSTPGLDTVYFEKPCSFCNETAKIDLQVKNDIFFLLYTKQPRLANLTLFHAGPPYQKLLERPNLIKVNTIKDKGDACFYVVTQLTPVIDSFKIHHEILKFENGVFTSFGQWDDYFYNEDTHFLWAWSNGETEIFHLDSNFSQGYHLASKVKMKGEPVKKALKYVSAYTAYTSLMNRDNNKFAFFTAIKDSSRAKTQMFVYDDVLDEEKIIFDWPKVDLLTIIDSNWNKLAEYRLPEEHPFYHADHFDESFIYKRNGLGAFTVYWLSNPNSSFNITGEEGHYKNHWIFPSLDLDSDQKFLKTIEINKGKVRQDSLPFSGQWEMLESNGKHFIAFDRSEKLVIFSLGSYKRPIQQWDEVKSWKIENGLLFISRKRKDSATYFDLIVYDFADMKMYTYAQKSNFEIKHLKKDADSPSLDYLSMYTITGDSTWLEMVTLPNFKVIIPLSIYSVKKISFEKIIFYGTEENVVSHVLILDKERGGKKYMIYDFPNMKPLDSINHVVQFVRLDKGLVYSGGSALLTTENGKVYFLTFNPYIRTFLNNKLEDEDLRVDDGIIIIPSRDTLFFHDSHVWGAPLIAFFAFPESFSGVDRLEKKNMYYLDRVGYGFVFETIQGDKKSLWKYDARNNQISLFYDAVSSWRCNDYGIEISIQETVKSKSKTEFFTLDSLGNLQLAAKKFDSGYAWTNLLLKVNNSNTFWGKIEDTINRVTQFNYFVLETPIPSDKAGFSYSTLLGSIPNVSRFYAQSNNDRYYKFLTKDSRGNLCLCPIEKQKLDCSSYLVPFDWQPSDMLRLNDSLLLAFDSTFLKEKNESIGKVGIYSLKSNEKIREIHLKNFEDYSRMDRWKLSIDGKWLTFEESYTQKHYNFYLGSQEGLDKILKQELHFSLKEASEFGIELERDR